jgi:2-keto-4-pentenoate hydratase/2-oxohepta-3-ene-1,7-dioic acid hydratase in catechol pathway
MRLARARAGDRIVHGEVVDQAFHVFTTGFLEGRERSGETLDLADLTLLSPLRPGKILLVLGGFLPADGTPMPPGAAPRVTVKALHGEVNGSGGEFLIPRIVTPPIWMEPEIAAVIGKTVYDASESESEEAILGYTMFNDVSAPEFLVDADGNSLARPDYLRAKSIETFAAMGPWIETDVGESDHKGGIGIWARVNGELVAEGNTRTAKFPPRIIVQYVSQVMTLFPGDVLALGTPQPALARPGDVAEVGADRIGSIHNRISSR